MLPPLSRAAWNEQQMVWEYQPIGLALSSVRQEATQPEVLWAALNSRFCDVILNSSYLKEGRKIPSQHICLCPLTSW